MKAEDAAQEYEKLMGIEAANRQRRLAAQASACKCGAEHAHPHEHGARCPVRAWAPIKGVHEGGV